jgi:hypothetical protein
VRALSAVRLVPLRLARLLRRPAPPATAPAAAAAAAPPFVPLAQKPGAEIVFGLIGQFWTKGCGYQQVAPRAFAAFNRPGFAKVALTFAMHAQRDGRSLLTSETRVDTTDVQAGQRFRRYWRLIGPGAGLLMRRLLALIKAEAEQAARRRSATAALPPETRSSRWTGRMMDRRFAARLFLVVGVVSGGYTLVLRPRMLHWGATADEQTRPLPGDDLVPRPNYTTTRAITIRTPAHEIWRWLVQMGQDRAGFYTHNWVEQLLLSGIPDVHEIHPEWQALNVGDLIRTNREIRAGHALGWSVAIVDPDRTLVVRSKSLPLGTYTFVLDPIDRQTTRLIARDRAVWSWWQSPFLLLVYEPLHAYMQTGVLQGIQRRAEALAAQEGAQVNVNREKETGA